MASRFSLTGFMRGICGVKHDKIDGDTYLKTIGETTNKINRNA